MDTEKTKAKTISVVMCTYNGEKYIREQLDSILRQTHPADEIIIQDDCSTDNTYNILIEYQKKHPTIQIYCNSQNMGINSNFFNAISKATSDYIAIADQDDIWEDYKLELQIQTIGNKLLCGERSTPFTDGEAIIRIDPRIPNYSLLRQIFVGTMAGHTLFFPKTLLQKIPDISNFTSVRCYDSILIIVAGAYESIVYINKNLVKQRRHITAATYTAPIDNKKSITNIYKSIKRTWNYNKILKPEIKRRLQLTLTYLKQIPSQEQILKDAIQMLNLYLSNSILDFIHLECFCMKRYKCFFYTTEINPLIGRIRALYFPVSLSDYYRYLLKDYLPSK